MEESNATAASMGRIWRKNVQFENVRHEFANVRKLLEDLNLWMPQRMVMIAFERDKFHPTSQCGRKLLRGCLETLPDNKSVEDIHLPVVSTPFDADATDAAERLGDARAAVRST